MPADLLIKNAWIIDGTGSPRRRGDIAVKDGCITGVGRVSEGAAKTVDATGLAATPGFIDVHTHYDAQLLWDPMASCSLWHGVTTVVTTNCGFAIAPVRAKDQDYTVRSLARVEAIELSALEATLPWSWETVGEYMDVLEGRLGINAIVMVGHSALRRYVMGQEASERTATDEELQAMCRVLRESVQAGAMGFTSTSSAAHWDGDGKPVPSRLANHEEFKAFAGAMRGMRVGFWQGIGDPTKPQGRERVSELMDISGLAYCWSQITQTVTDPPDAWRKQVDALQELVASGRRYFAMGPSNRTTYEMTLENNSLFNRWPSWQEIQVIPVPRRMKVLADPAVRERLKEEMKKEPLPVIPFHWRLVTLVRSVSGRWKRFEGKTVPEIAEAMGKHPLDAALDIALDEGLDTQFRVSDTRYPNEDVLVEILKAPHVLVGMSDAGAHMVRQINTGYTTRLLGYWSRERQKITAEEAVHVLSGRAADELGLADRGHIAAGQAADIVLLDLDKVGDGEREFVNDLPRGAARLVQHAHGIESVYVNGVLAREGDRDTGNLGGHVIRGSVVD